MTVRLSSRRTLFLAPACLAVFAAVVMALLLAGSALGRPDTETATPISVVSKEQLEQTQLSVDVLKVLNEVRADPKGYADQLRARPRLRGVGASDMAEALAFLDGQQSLPPLTFSPPLGDVALFHARDIGALGLTSHTGSRGTTMGGRFRARGLTPTLTAEELSFGQRSGADVVLSLIIDSGVPGKPHRSDLFNPVFSFAGVGCAPHKGMGQVCVINMSNSFMRPPPSISLAFTPATATRFSCPAGQQPTDADAVREDLFRRLTDTREPPAPSHWSAFAGANALGQQHLDQELGVNFAAYGSMSSPPWTPPQNGGLLIPFCAPQFGPPSTVAEGPQTPPAETGFYGSYDVGSFDWLALDGGGLEFLGLCTPADEPPGVADNLWAGTIGGDVVFGDGGRIGAFAGYRDIDGDWNPFGAEYDQSGWPAPDGTTAAPPGVSSPDVADLYAGYSYSTSYGYTSIQAGINDVFNTPPPRIYDGLLANSGAENYDFLGRYFYIGLRHCQ